MLLSVAWSLGFHVWTPLPNSMTLALAEPGKAGARLGKVGAAARPRLRAGLAIAFALTLLGVKDPAAVRHRRRGRPPGRRRLPRHTPPDQGAGAELCIPKALCRYYVLNFLEGWRKQIAIAFGGFLLVKIYGARLLDILVLAAIIQAIGYFTSSRVGR